MAWVKLDDHFFRNTKVLAAGRDGRDLYLAGLCYCGAGLTDGVIPASAIRIIAAEADVDDHNAAAQTLVDVGLWHKQDGGYVVHDYLEYNPTREKALQTRAARAEAGRVGGKQKASNLLEASQRFALAKPVAKTKQNSTPYPSRPVPVIEPVQNEDRSASDRAGASKKPQRLREEWTPMLSETEASSKFNLSPSVIRLETEKFRDHFKSTGDAKLDWDAAWRNWMRRVPEMTRTGPPSNGYARGGASSNDFLAYAQRLGEQEG